MSLHQTGKPLAEPTLTEKIGADLFITLPAVAAQIVWLMSDHAKLTDVMKKSCEHHFVAGSGGNSELCGVRHVFQG